VLVVDTSPPALEFVSSEDAGRLVRVGAACPDHLVHTKRVALWIPFDPATDSPETLVERIRERAAGYRREYRSYFERFADRSATAADSDARVILIQPLGLIASGTTVQKPSLSRDPYLRAIEVMAGANASDAFVSLD